jgi:hypothetical protein
MEWSSDGYVLAVGWEKGWAVWSVAGRCLAWSFGWENQTDETKYEKVHLERWQQYSVQIARFKDTFMNGIQDLVGYSIYIEFHFLRYLTVLGSW